MRAPPESQLCDSLRRFARRGRVAELPRGPRHGVRHDGCVRGELAERRSIEGKVLAEMARLLSQHAFPGAPRQQGGRIREVAPAAFALPGRREGAGRLWARMQLAI